MTSELQYFTYDVFTRVPFGGNPLAIFPDATHLPDGIMQRIAGEMNLSETVFLGPPETSEGTARVRIFTPSVEVPFAGHPTVGSAIFLAGSEPSKDPGSVVLVLEENVGSVPVEVRFEDGRATFARFTTAVPPEHRPSPFTPEELAGLVGLEPADVCPEGWPAEMVSCGLPYFIIPLASVDAARRAVLDSSKWRSLLADSWAHHVYLVSPDAEAPDVDLRVRMFAPGSGVAEDPATGSAAAALGGYLSALSGRASGTLSWTVEQGLEMGRPSLLYVEAERSGGRTTAVRVGGGAVPVCRGTMAITD